VQSAKYVKGYAAWNNISKTCVHSGRLDIAKICLGSIGKARALYAIRSLPDDDDLRLGRLAICLGRHRHPDKNEAN
jgi:intraflagellar transport protein 140